MLTVSDRFNAIARGAMRQLNWRVLMSFDRVFDDAITFFTLDTSVLDGPDFLQGEGNVVQEWDKYAYVDYTDRLLHMEWSREEDVVSGISLGIADIVFDNHDNFFTPGSGSAVDGYVLPSRPVRLYAGFGDELVPVLIGLTEGMGKINERDKTITFHVLDFLRAILDRPIDEASLQIEQRVDTVLDDLLQAAGLVPAQYSLDIGQNTISFAYFERGTKLGTAVDKLMEAEFGRFYMDANGLLQFKNRENYASTPVYSFSKNNILSFTRRDVDDIINVVEIAGRRRVVGSTQDVGQLGTAKFVPGSSSADIWIDFVDPVTSVDSPVYYTSSITSFFRVNSQEDGNGTDQATAVTLTDLDLFTGSCKMTFTNSSSSGYWVTQIKLFGTPARPVGEMFIREADATSVSKYDEHVRRIDNDFFQTLAQAQSKALILLDDMAEYAPAEQLTVKGNMALEAGDVIEVFNQDRQEYAITKSTNIMDGSSYTQRLDVKQFNRREYFILNQSVLDGVGALAP